MKKKVNVIMLPTKKATVVQHDLLKCIKSFTYNDGTPEDTEVFEDSLCIGISKQSNEEYYEKQEIYFVSDDESIMVSDWLITPYNEVFQCVKFKGGMPIGANGNGNLLHNKKIIASTNPEIYLPKIPVSFIELYVKKQGKISEVGLDHEEHIVGFNEMAYTPRLNVKNEVIIIYNPREFLSYELSLKLKLIGFNEPCLAMFSDESLDMFINENEGFLSYINSDYDDSRFVSAPTFRQAFKFLREHHDWPIESWIFPFISESPRKYEGFYWRRGETFSVGIYDTYEEAELALLIKLIEIV